MSRSPFYSKFRSNLHVLREAIEGNVDLDYQHPKVYKKLCRYYKDMGVQFYDDPSDDYELVLNCLEQDLIDSGVLV